MTYSQFGCCGNHQISANYVVDNLVMCENRVHTHTFSSRVFYRKYLKCQRVSNSFFSGFANRFLRLISLQHSSAPPCGGSRSIASSHYGVTSRHSPCHVGNAVFSFQLLTLKNKMIAEGKKRYEHPSMTIINLEITQMIATSGDVTVGG